MKINGQEIKITELGFSEVKELSLLGVELSDLALMLKGKKVYPVASAIVAVYGGVSTDIADKLLEQHLINGGTLEEMFAEINEAIDNSGFIQALLKGNKTKPTKKEPLKVNKADN